jgi:hypothetical protein
MQKSLFFLALAIFTTAAAQAEPASLPWPSRNSDVICGGTVDGETLAMRVSTDDVLAAESVTGRIMVYVDLHRPGQVRWLIADVLGDDDYDQRQELLKKLTAEDADLIRKITAGRQIDIYAGLTDGIVHLRTDFGKRSFSLSCQEIARAK